VSTGLTPHAADVLHKLLVAPRPLLVCELVGDRSDPETRAALVQLRSFNLAEGYCGAWRVVDAHRLATRRAVNDARQYHAACRALGKAA
jgi:hypothetical protein